MICALIPDISSSQAVTLTGQESAGQQLERVVNVCAFIQCLPHTPPVFRFHSLFRDVLWEMSPGELGVEVFAEYKQHAVRLLIELGQVDKAVELLEDLKAWNSLIELIETHAENLLAKGQVHTLKTWIQTVPKETGSNVDWLIFWEACCDLQFTPVKARQRLEYVLSNFKKERDNTGVYLSWSYIVESYFIERYKSEPLDHWQQMLSELYRDYPVPDSTSIRARVAYAQYIIIVSRTNRIDRKLDDEMFGLLHSSLPVNQKIDYGTFIIFRTANLYKGRERCQEVQLIIRQLLATEEVSPLNRYFWSISQVYYDYFFADSLLSLSNSLNEVRDIGERHGFRILWRSHQLFLCHAYCIEGQISEAKKILNFLDTNLFDTNVHDYCYSKIITVYYHLVNGQTSVAKDINERELQALPPVNPIDSGHRGLINAQIALCQGDRREVLQNLAHVRNISRTISNMSLEFSVRMLLAFFALKNKSLRRCQEILRHAFALGKAQGYRRYFMQTPDNLPRLCAIALNADIEPDYAKTLIRTNRLIPPTDLICDAWPWSVRILALGPLKVEINGKALVFQGKAQAKPMGMLKALIFNAGQPVHVEQVAVTLWPDADEQKVKANIKATLHRLRKLLGQDAVVLREGYLQLNPACCWLDIIAFQRLLKRTHDEPIPTEMLEECLRLYRGALLKDNEIPDSAIHLSLELNTFFLNNVLLLAQRFIVEGKLNQAIEWLLRGLEEDPLSEPLAQELIQLYLQLNRVKEAVAFYQCFCERLIKDLDIEPSDELKSVLEQHQFSFDGLSNS